MPSTVTWRSSMHSSSADWVLGEARLISSPTTMLAKIAPGLNSNSRVSWLQTETPVMSLGSRSGVNWIRRTEQSMERASALASIVLPTPGTSSMSRWPSASRTVSARRTASVLPAITCSTAPTMRAAAFARRPSRPDRGAVHPCCSSARHRAVSHLSASASAVVRTAASPPSTSAESEQVAHARCHRSRDVTGRRSRIPGRDRPTRRSWLTMGVKSE